MEPNPEFVKELTHKLERDGVGAEQVFWALKDLIRSGTPLLQKDAK